MYLTPDQIDRQPFRMRKRGYDISQVREFRRQSAQQMREHNEDPPAVTAPSVLARARAEATEIIEQAERSARRRSDEVLRETQARLDELLAEERLVHERIATATHEADDAEVIELPPLIQPEQARGSRSLAEFMKSAVRDEVSN